MSSTGSRPRSAAARPRSGVRSGRMRSKLIVEALAAWLTIQLGRVSGRAHPGRGHPLRPAPLAGFGPVPRGWPDRAGHERYRASHPADRPRQEERPLRRLGQGLRHWAIVASLVATAKLNGVEPFMRLTDVLERMVSGARQGERARAPAALGLEGREQSSRLSQLLDP